MDKLSVVIITKNEEANIGRCLTSVKKIADEIVVVDSGSTDGTEKLCRENGARFIVHPFVDFSSQKQLAVDEAENDYVLSIDADEWLSEGMMQEVEKLKREGFKQDGYRIRRQTYYEGRLLRHCGLEKESHLRLFDRRKGMYANVKVHETFEMMPNAKIGDFQSAFYHKPYKDLAHSIEKMNMYTTMWAQDKSEKDKRVSLLQVGMKFPLQFLNMYFLKLAFLDGYAGFIWTMTNAYYTYLKYAKLYDLNKEKQR